MANQDKSKELAAHVNDALLSKSTLKIIGGNSKAFYGRKCEGKQISIEEHAGIINYQPGELVITARAGTPLSELESVLAEKNQRLLFEPPHFATSATLGGTIATNMNGPGRPWSGSVKDALLGVKIINGRGEVLSFGGEVMKNVAGYDVSRLMAGSLGTLGILLDVSLKVLPIAQKTITLMFEKTEQEAIEHCSNLNQQYLPLSAMSYYDNILYIRLSGNAASVDSAHTKLGGELLPDSDFWHSIREQSHPFFKQTGTLWRLSVPPATATIESLPGHCLIDWGGAQRWLVSTANAETVRNEVKQVNGHATIFRNGDVNDVFQPLTAAQEHLHLMVKQAFDPSGIFNPGRLYPNL